MACISVEQQWSRSGLNKNYGPLPIFVNHVLVVCGLWLFLCYNGKVV